jgi:hypothetical protein
MLKKLNISKKAFAIWLLWFFICLSFWMIPSGKVKSEVFLFTHYSDYYALRIWRYWDYQETFVFGIGPLILYVFTKTLFGTKQ